MNEMDTFFIRYKLPKLTQEGIDDLNGSVSINKAEFVHFIHSSGGR